MSDKPTKDWWMCFCDGAGNVHHIQLKDVFENNRARCVDGCMEPLPVGMADSLDKSEGIGRMMKRTISAERNGEVEQGAGVRKGKVMKKMFKRFDNATASIMRIILLPAALQPHGLTDDLSDFLSEESFDDIERLLGPLGEDLKDSIERERWDDVVDEFYRKEILGVLMRFKTPVMEHINNGNAKRYSWGYCRTEWVYGKTFEEALDAGFAWVESVRSKEKASPSEQDSSEAGGEK